MRAYPAHTGNSHAHAGRARSPRLEDAVSAHCFGLGVEARGVASLPPPPFPAFPSCRACMSARRQRAPMSGAPVRAARVRARYTGASATRPSANSMMQLHPDLVCSRVLEAPEAPLGGRGLACFRSLECAARCRGSVLAARRALPSCCAAVPRNERGLQHCRRKCGWRLGC